MELEIMINLGGINGTNIADVTVNKNLQITERPSDAVAWNSLGVQTGLITGLAANAPIFAFVNKSANLILIRRVGVGFITSVAFTTAQKTDYGLIVGRNYTTYETVGTNITFTGNNAKHRVSLSIPTSLDVKVAIAAAVSGGVKVLDTNHLGQTGGWSAGVGVTVQPTLDNLFSHNAGDYPIVLQANEGILITNLTAMGVVGVGTAYINLEFAEVTSF
jgi:hypothetical protein